MSTKPVFLREQARRDAEAAIAHYMREAGVDVALDFVDALEFVYRSIANRPGAGSLRYAHELALPGLRSRGLKRYPYLIFYIERADHIDIWRVLHSRRDIPISMQGPES